jgi:luciferase-like monooxygenase
MEPLPARRGPRPRTHMGLPHQQLDQQPDDDRVRDALAKRVFALPDVREEPSGISVPGARALVLDASDARGPREAFLVGNEFAHLHPGADRSLHLALPESRAKAACEKGWAELHPLAASGGLPRTIVMVYAPRDMAEVEVVAGLVEASHRFATGADTPPAAS